MFVKLQQRLQALGQTRLSPLWYAALLPFPFPRLRRSTVSSAVGGWQGRFSQSPVSLSNAESDHVSSGQRPTG